MKYIKRILIILFLVIMISGCKVNYDLKINKDLSVNEKVTVSENTDRMKSRTNLDVNQSVKYLYDIYKLDHMSDNNYSIVSSSYLTEVVTNNSYKDIDDYYDKFSNDIYGLLKYSSDKSDISLSFIQEDLINSKTTNRYIYDEINVTIEVPFKVIDNNADKVVGNKYTWTVKADATDTKDIFIEFDGTKLDDSLSFNLGDSIVNIKYGIIVIGIVLFAAIVIGIVIYINNKKNNKM